MRQQNKASKTVIPARCEASNYDVQLHIGESRDSGSGAAHHPGMTPNIMGCTSSQTLKPLAALIMLLDGGFAVRQAVASY